MTQDQEDWSARVDNDLRHEPGERRRATWRGHEAAWQDGRRAATRHALMAIYQARHGEVPDALGERIFREEDLDALQSWLERFATLDAAALQRALA
jgi:hypothetical protein